MTLVTVMRDPEATPAARISAANALLDRGWGKAGTSVEMRKPGPNIGELVQEAHQNLVELISTPLTVEIVGDETDQDGNAAEPSGNRMPSTGSPLLGRVERQRR